MIRHRKTIVFLSIIQKGFYMFAFMEMYMIGYFGGVFIQKKSLVTGLLSLRRSPMPLRVLDQAFPDQNQMEWNLMATSKRSKV